MIRGYCIGGGLGIAMCCDLRIAADHSTFAVPAAKLGLGYGHPGVKRLMDVVGPSFTKEIFYTARQFKADEAVTMGLINRVVPDAELESYVTKYAETIAGNAPLTIKALKTVVQELVKDEGQRSVKAMEGDVNACFKSKDYIEGRNAFMEKRKPVFTGTYGRGRSDDKRPQHRPGRRARPCGALGRARPLPADGHRAGRLDHHDP